ncbi:MAG TPA: hypothetical protein VJC13_02445 [Candidatus Paceibacterota bacterium]
MFPLIEKLRQKPSRTKKQIAFVVSFLLAGVIFVIWLSIIYPDFSQRQAKEISASKLEPSPISNFGETFSSGLSAIGAQFSKIKESLSSLSTTTYYFASTTQEATTTIEQ